jgi:hypothetical protein
MKEKLKQWSAPLFALILIVGLSACGSTEKPQTQEAASQSSTPSSAAVSGLPQGFPTAIPFYNEAQVIESDNFNGNSYTVLYLVDAEYDAVVSFYLDAFQLDDSGLNDGVAYYEGFDYGEILIKGLTIEDNGDGVNVFMTLQDNSQDSLEATDDSDDAKSSDTMTYETAQEVALDQNYPQDVLPIHPNAKVIGCSMVPGSDSGFVDLILPADDFDDAVSFYCDALGISPKNSTTTVQEAAEFKGELDGLTYSLFVSHLLVSGNDTFVQITLNEK